MESLISELLLYSKLDLPHVPYEMRELDLLAYFEDYLEDLRPHLAKRNIHITLEYDRSHSYLVMADREKLNRVVANIVQNSISFMDKENKHLKFKLTSNNKEVLIEIQDNGMGVSRDELPYLFDRFYRTDVSRNSTTGGSGLGLAIVKKIIDGHGGAVWARGDIGQGLRIYFTLKKRVEADHVEQDIGD